MLRNLIPFGSNEQPHAGRIRIGIFRRSLVALLGLIERVGQIEHLFDQGDRVVRIDLLIDGFELGPRRF